MLACAVCGEPNPERARFCLQCGAPIGREAAPPHNLLGDAALDAGARARITELSGGNPLYLEELTAMLMDAGHLQRDHGVWYLPATEPISVPPTIQALLGAVLRAAGRDAEAQAAFARALDLLDRKGNLVLARRVRGELPVV